MNNNEPEKVVKPVRPVSLDNKVIVVDGLVGGGKGLMCSVISSIPSVEMWIHRPNIEQICAMHHLKNITLNGASSLINTWVDEEFINLSMSRNTNFRPSDESSIFKDPRRYRYWSRLFQHGGESAKKRVIEENRVINLMTHANSAYSEPIFKAFSDRLVYIRIVRCPMSDYMINHLSNWSQRWGSEVRSGMVLHEKIDSNNKYITPFFMLGDEIEYYESSGQERAVMMIDRWQTDGNVIIDDMKNKSLSKIIEIPFEKFVMNPNPYVKKISDAINTTPDHITKKELIKQGVPRRSITDAPYNSNYEKAGWKKPEKYLSFAEEIDRVRSELKKVLPTNAMSLLESITADYINRYNM